MDQSILIQKQVKDNAEDLQREFLDMKNWEEQMKRKDEELRREASGQMVLPPIRTRYKDRTKKVVTKENATDVKSKRIKSYDYPAWDKFDVDKACTEIDKEESDDSENKVASKEELGKAHQIATKYKNEGNTFVQQQKWIKAIECYNKAIKAFPYDAVFYANRALCQLKLDNFHSAESDCSAAIQLDEAYVKAYHRRATARMNLKQYKEAKQDIEKIIKLEPSNKEAKSLLDKVQNKIQVSEPKKSSIGKHVGKEIGISTEIKGRVIDAKGENVVKNIEDSSCSTGEIDKTEKVQPFPLRRDPRIPDWLPEKDDVAVIEVAQKPPHLRSKKLLTRVPIEEIEFDTLKCNHNRDKTECSTTESILLKDTSEHNNVIKSSNFDRARIVEDSSVPPVPRTAVRFITDWKRLGSSKKYQYLKQLSKNSLQSIFQDSMESDIFSEILTILKIEFIERKEPVFRYLNDLSQIKRFRALIMFTSNDDKRNLEALFEHCETVERVSQEELEALQEKYEIRRTVS